MREILFRGKRTDDGEWMCGNLTVWSDGSASIDREPTASSPMYAVIPETIGQYTGLTDKNGKKIFEGDIVLFPWDNEDKEVFCIEFVEGEFMAIPKRKSTDIWCIRIGSYSPDFEVIGNIHDNPEFLTKEDAENALKERESV